MPNRRPNTQMFALREAPSSRLIVAGAAYRLVRVFKHDFFAATCLYEAVEAAEWPRIVVKFHRTQRFFGLPTAWAGRLMCRHERAVYAALAGVAGVPRWIGQVGPAGGVVEYVNAVPLDHFPSGPPAGFFDRLRGLFDAVHARGVGYCDANKRSNILVSPAGEPFLVDFQISIRRRDDWPRPLRSVVAACVAYVQRCDLYHLYKHKRRLCPRELTPAEHALSLRRGRLHTLHRKLTDPWRVVRRRFLSRQHARGRLVSPTEAIEDHDQPEKATWRRAGKR